MEDLFQLAIVAFFAAVLLLAGLLFMEYIGGPAMPRSSQ